MLADTIFPSWGFADWGRGMGDSEEKERSAITRNLAIHALNTGISVILAVMAVNNDIIGNRNDQLGVAYERISQLEADNAILRGNQLEQVAVLAGLQHKIDSDFSPMIYLGEYLNSVGLPMWIKVWDPATESFSVLMTNEAYTAQYGILGNDYRGESDRAVWPESLAEEFEKNDLAVLNSKRRRLVEEYVIIPGKGRVRRKIWKHYLLLPDGREAVAGIDIDAALIDGR